MFKKKQLNNIHYYNQATIIKIVRYGIKDRPGYQRTRIESIETDLHLYSQVTKVIQWGRE